MIIEIDADYDAHGTKIASQFIDTGALGLLVPHPVTGVGTVTILQLLTHLQNNKSALAAHGYNLPTKLKGYPPGTTRWQVIVAEASKAGADANVKALGLT